MDISSTQLIAFILSRLEVDSHEFLYQPNSQPGDLGRHLGRQEAYEIVLREIWNMQDKLDQEIDKDLNNGTIN